MPGFVRASALRSDALGRLPLTKRGNGDVAFRIAGSPSLTQRETQLARVIEDAYSHLSPQVIIDLFEDRNFAKFAQANLAALAPFAPVIEKIILDQFEDSGQSSGDEIASQISQDYRAVGKAEEIIPSAASMLFKFDRTSPTALAYAQSSSASMITNMASSNLVVFRSLVTQAYESGLTPQALSSKIFTALQTVNPSGSAGAFASTLGVSMNGLTTRYEQAVMTRANRLIDISLKSGISAEKAVAKAQKDAQRYADRLRRARAKTIARTELLKANNEGRLESFVQAQKKGLIGKDARKVWATSRFDVCNICAPLNGQMAPLKSPFPNGIMTPPAHPNCRCSITLISNVKTHKPPMSLGTGKPGDPLLTTFGGPTELGQTLAETPLPDVPLGTSLIATPKVPTTTIQVPSPPPPAPPAPVAPPSPVSPPPPTSSAQAETIAVKVNGKDVVVTKVDTPKGEMWMWEQPNGVKVAYNPDNMEAYVVNALGEIADIPVSYTSGSYTQQVMMGIDEALSALAPAGEQSYSFTVGMNIEWNVGPLATEADTYVATNGTVTFKYDAKAQTWAKFKPSKGTWEAAEKVPQTSQLGMLEEKLISVIPKPSEAKATVNVSFTVNGETKTVVATETKPGVYEYKLKPTDTQLSKYDANTGQYFFKNPGGEWQEFATPGKIHSPIHTQLQALSKPAPPATPAPLPSAVAPKVPKAPKAPEKLKLPAEPKKVGKKGEVIAHTINPDGSVWVKGYTYKGTEYGWMRQPDGTWIKGYKFNNGSFQQHLSSQFTYINSKTKLSDLKILEEHLASKGYPVGGGIPSANPVPTPPPSAPSVTTPSVTAPVSSPPASSGGAQALKPISVPEPVKIPANSLEGFEKVGTSRGVLVEDHAAASRLGGQNPKRVFTDPTSGQQFIFKPQPRWQALLEEASADTTARLGINGPKVAVVEIDGQVGSLHRVMATGGKVDEVKPAFKGAFDATKLSQDQAEALQVNQILDHLLSNHDAHADQFIRLSSAEDPLFRAIGIDKGQAFKHLGKARETESLFNAFPGHALFNPNNNAVGKQPYIQLWEAFFSGKDVSVVAPSQSTEIQTILKRVRQLLDKPNDPFWDSWTAVSREMAAAGKAQGPTAVVDALRKRLGDLETQVAKMEKEILASAPGRNRFLANLPDPEAQRNIDAILAEIDPHLAVKGNYEYKTESWWRSTYEPQLQALKVGERSAIKSYTGSSYRTINRALEEAVRKGKDIDSLGSALANTIRKMDAGMAKSSLPEPVKVYRGAGSVKIQGGRVVSSARDAQGLVGKILEQEGFTSTTIVKGGGFGGEFALEISCPAGTKGHYVAPISNFASEKEFLIDRHYRYLVTGVRKEGSKTIIEATVIPEQVGTSIVPTTPKPL